MRRKTKFLITIGICLLSACNSVVAPARIPISQRSNIDLMQCLQEYENSDTSNSEYGFQEIVDELESRGSSASETAPVLAKAMAFDRRGSVIAGKPLIVMGTSATSSIPYLLQNLDNDREEVRRYSVFVLGFLGKDAKCTVPKIASLLWDKEPFVRSASAGALAEITNNNLVEYDYLKLDPDVFGSVSADNPEGSVSGIAREWWLNTGQNMDWPIEKCEMLK